MRRALCRVRSLSLELGPCILFVPFLYQMCMDVIVSIKEVYILQFSVLFMQYQILEPYNICIAHATMAMECRLLCIRQHL